MSQSLSRRAFGRQLLAGVTAGCAALPGQHPNPAGPVTCPPAAGGDEAFDYVIVGSGAGGGPLAANLARAGYRVLLLEAGGQDEPYAYQVPAYHALATEDPQMRWDFFVRHYADEARQRRTPSTCDRRGVYYPRASTLGGCTAHNAMITISPHTRDWDRIAEAAGRPLVAQRRHVEVLPAARAVPVPRPAPGRRGCHREPGPARLRRLAPDQPPRPDDRPAGRAARQDHRRRPRPPPSRRRRPRDAWWGISSGSCS